MKRLSWRTFRPHPVLLASLIAIVILGATMLGGTGRVSAHAELVHADPPIDGLVIAPPAQLHLFFSEAVKANNPAPVIHLFSETGVEQPVTVEPPGANGNTSELVIDVKDLNNGTWTVAWTVTSADDGHTLSGTYAFRIGGGLPPGIATVEGQQPQAWAVATRWLTFIGAAIAGGGFLFGLLFANGAAEPIRSSRRRSQLILAGAAVALIATIIEPPLQVAFPPAGVSLSIGDAIRGLPDAWWYRPIALIPLLVLSFIVAYPLRGRIPRWASIVGGILGLVSLLGLSLTSHASARQSWKLAATGSDTLHQWSTALWVGGLASLALWWVIGQRLKSETSTETVPAPLPLPLARFSTIALGLFIVAVVTGLVNAGFSFPTKTYASLNGWKLPAISKLWSSDYGYVLLVKSLVLLLPFGFAVYHHRTIATAAKSGVALVGSALTKTLRLEALLVLAVALGGSIMALSAPPTISHSALNKVVLTAFAYPAKGDPRDLVHFTIEPATQGNNSLAIRLTDNMGKVPADASSNPARIALDFTSLSHGTVRGDVSVAPVDLAQATYSSKGLDLSFTGWWEIEATVTRANQPDATATFYMILPDPNVHGFSAPPSPKSDDRAQELYASALNKTIALTSLRRDEYIGSGSDALVISNYAWTTGANQHPASFSSRTLYSGGFQTYQNGSPPPLPSLDPLSQVAIGGQSWVVGQDGSFTPEQPILYQPPSQWASTFTGAEQFQLGTTQVIDGETCQIVSFHTPNAPGQSEAWFSWWIGVDSGQMRQLTMVANQHYMIWHNYDFDQDFVIQGPSDSTSAPSRPIPAATPAPNPYANPNVWRGATPAAAPVASPAATPGTN
jgi:putative copper export protein/methionine-rich copper-binding protein CopC